MPTQGSACVQTLQANLSLHLASNCTLRMLPYILVCSNATFKVKRAVSNQCSRGLKQRLVPSPLQYHLSPHTKYGVAHLTRISGLSHATPWALAAFVSLGRSSTSTTFRAKAVNGVVLLQIPPRSGIKTIQNVIRPHRVRSLCVPLGRKVL